MQSWFKEACQYYLYGTDLVGMRDLLQRVLWNLVLWFQSAAEAMLCVSGLKTLRGGHFVKEWKWCVCFNRKSRMLEMAQSWDGNPLRKAIEIKFSQSNTRTMGTAGIKAGGVWLPVLYGVQMNSPWASDAQHEVQALVISLLGLTCG